MHDAPCQPQGGDVTGLRDTGNTPLTTPRYHEDAVSTVLRWLAERVIWPAARRMRYGKRNVRWHLERLGDRVLWRAIRRSMRQFDAKVKA